MPIPYTPKYVITPRIISCLMRVERVREKAVHMPLTPTVLNSLRETARLLTTHYSTGIEGNLLEPEQVEAVLKHEGHFPGRERDEREVKGHYAALHMVEQIAASDQPINENVIQTIHALVMSDGRTKVRPSPYRDGQNVIRDAMTRTIIYMPPEAKDVPDLMHALVDWIAASSTVPYPLIAAIAHYQCATIHPYYDGNGRTARLLTTLILHRGGYDLKGLYSLEEYYARRLGDYYEALRIGESHNYYLGRAEADITKWIEYFIEGMASSFESVLRHMAEATGTRSPDQSHLLRDLDPRQRKALTLFQTSKTITSRELCTLFGCRPRTAAHLAATWVANGFLEIANPSKKGRTYTRVTSNLEILSR